MAEKYKKIEKLSEGAYGSVFKVEKDGIYYALKRYKEEIDLNELDVLFLVLL